MAIAVKINFENTYEVKPLSNDFRISSFKTELENGSSALLKVEISNQPHELLPNVYNLAFGPPNARGRINDIAELAHKDYSKVFSTILLEAATYLQNNKGHYIGIDGSNNSRAYLYYMFIQKNYNYLSKHFDMFGLKYYVRITRFGKTQYENPFDFSDILSSPVKLEKGINVPPHLMYNYFIFNLKK